MMKPAERYDVVICGGGLAGLTLSRQLKRAMPDLTVLVLERTAGDIPDGAHKVGEATVEGGAHYFTEQLGLTGYFNKHHLHKLGLRLFFGDSHGPFEARPELGARRFPRVPSYQIDRGIFERDLRQRAGELDVEEMAAATSPRWKPKTQERRWFSTNHLMGRGYWVWMIPLSSGNTSIGIVTDERIHPFKTYSTESTARQWLAEHEPTLAEF